VILTSDNNYIIAGYTESFGEGEKDAYIIKADSVLNLNEILNLPANPDKGDIIYYNDTLRFYNGIAWRNFW